MDGADIGEENKFNSPARSVQSGSKGEWASDVGGQKSKSTLPHCFFCLCPLWKDSVLALLILLPMLVLS